MKAVIQRVQKAQVKVDEKIVGKIEQGILVFLGVVKGDTEKEANYLAKKISQMRIFEDENQKMNQNIKQVRGKLLIVSQFTLYADCTNGNRPSFTRAEEPKRANELYQYFCQQCENQNIVVEKGIFGADMKIDLLNDGPVTIVLEKEREENEKQLS